MKRLSLAALAALFAPVLLAATSAQVGKSTAPTTYTNGAALVPSEITGYDIDCAFTPAGAASAMPCTFSPSFIAGPVAAFTATVTYDGAVGGRACFRTRAKVVAGTVSDWSPLITPTGGGLGSCRDLAVLVPNAPGGVQITVTVNVTVTP